MYKNKTKRKEKTPQKIQQRKNKIYLSLADMTYGYNHGVAVIEVLF